jgi:hypothetical protein
MAENMVYPTLSELMRKRECNELEDAEIYVVGYEGDLSKPWLWVPKVQLDLMISLNRAKLSFAERLIWGSVM